MTEPQRIPQNLEPRFLQPTGWRWHSFTNPQGRRLRFGTVAPESHIPDGVVIVLPGLSEFSEKYFELAHDLLKHNLSMWVLDWEGQGKSDRPLKNRQKRYSFGFDQDVADLHFFIEEYVKHAAVHPDVGRIPLIMLAHSMGGNIGLRYLFRHPDSFACAAFTSPMIGIHAFRAIPKWLTRTVTLLSSLLLGKFYVKFTKGDWTPTMRLNPQNDILSSDPIRKQIQNKWSEADPALQVGEVTYKWVAEAVRSSHFVQKPHIAKNIHTPCFFGLAGQDKLVNNHAAKKFIARLPNAKMIELQDAKHEILMEEDGYRNIFLNGFFELLAVNRISEIRKPF